MKMTERETVRKIAESNGRTALAYIADAVEAERNADDVATEDASDAEVAEWRIAASVAEEESYFSARAAGRYGLRYFALVERDREPVCPLCGRTFTGDACYHGQERAAETVTYRRRGPAGVVREYSALRCESGWTNDRCTKRLGHLGDHSNP